MAYTSTRAIVEALRQLSQQQSLPVATTTTLGGVKIDGTTITINNTGVISSAGGSGGAGLTATGVVAGTYSNPTFVVNSYGQITQATQGLDPVVAAFIF